MKTLILSISIFTICCFNLLGQNLIGSEMLSRPTNTSITIKVIFDTITEAKISYGTSSGNYTHNTTWQSFSQDTTGEALAEIKLNNLTPDTKYFYKLQYRNSGDTSVFNRLEYSFHTAKPQGASFTFTVQADPHLDAASDTALYRLCLHNQLDDSPDFMIDLGDFLMTEKLKDSSGQVPIDTIPYRCKLLRSFYESVNHSVPLYNIIGNHEAENGWYLNGTSNNLAVWSTNFRKKYFSNPVPDNFYTGDTTHYNFVGQREAYYAWTWGDALFVVLDPYWFTSIKPDSLTCWRWTLGKEQYDWLKNTLENSTSKFKFVFAHQLVGANREARGGAEWAGYYEWGGLNADSTDGWAANRPGWYKPIKELLEENKVTIFFHGHDHFYAKQDLNCLIYQEVPQPDMTNFQNAPQAAEYGYTNGVIVPNAGHLRVNVKPNNVTVEYVRAFLPSQETGTRHNKDISDSYTIGLVNCYDSLQSVSPEISQNEFNLLNIFPNPTSNNLKIIIENIQVTKDLFVQIFDINGRLIKQINNFRNTNNKYYFEWDSSDNIGNRVISGSYICRVISDKTTLNQKIMIIR